MPARSLRSTSNSCGATVSGSSAMLLFCWKGAAVRYEWTGGASVRKPSKVVREWVRPVRPWLRRMLPVDRQYLTAFYEAAAFVLSSDGDRDEPILATTADFLVFHAGSLDLAVADGRLAFCPALCEAFVAAVGPECLDVTRTVRRRLVACCKALAYTLRVNDG